jgi:hypothetical protein
LLNTARPLCLVLLGLAFALPTGALGNAFTALDARSLALGGAGVAGTRPYNAPFFNPARLAGNPQVDGRRDDYAFFRPYVGARLIDRDGFLNALDQYQENNNDARLDQSLEDLEAAIRDLDVSSEDFRAVTRAGNDLLDDYRGLSDKPLRLVGSGGINFGYPSDRWGFGAHMRQNVVAGMEVRISENDLAAIQEVLDLIDMLIDLSEGAELPDAIELPRPTEGFETEFGLRGAMVRETAISLAAKLPGLEGTVVGLTLKSLDVETLDWVTDVNDAERGNFDIDDHSTTHTDFNVDFGITHDLDEHWTAGLMVRNAIRRNYETVLGNEVGLRPVARAGLAFQTRQWTVAWDVDLNEARAIGFDPAKRFFTIGTEYRPWRGLALRGGFRHEQVLNENEYSFGFGVGIRHAHFDIGVSTDGKDSMAAALQFGFRF